MTEEQQRREEWLRQPRKRTLFDSETADQEPITTRAATWFPPLPDYIVPGGYWK